MLIPTHRANCTEISLCIYPYINIKLDVVLRWRNPPSASRQLEVAGILWLDLQILDLQQVTLEKEVRCVRALEDVLMDRFSPCAPVGPQSN